MGKKIRYGSSVDPDEHDETRRYVVPIAAKPTSLPHPRLVRRMARGTEAPPRPRQRTSNDDFISEATTTRFD